MSNASAVSSDVVSSDNGSSEGTNMTVTERMVLEFLTGLSADAFAAIVKTAKDARKDPATPAAGEISPAAHTLFVQARKGDILSVVFAEAPGQVFSLRVIDRDSVKGPKGHTRIVVADASNPGAAPYMLDRSEDAGRIVKARFAFKADRPEKAAKGETTAPEASATPVAVSA